MNQLEESVVNAIDFLGTFHQDVSKLFGCVEDTVRNRGLAPLWGAQSVWERSSAYYNSAGWMPRYLCRAYVPASLNDKPVDSQQRTLALFLVYLAPRFVKRPTALWGMVSLIEKAEPWPIVKPLLLRDDGPPFLKEAAVSAWEKAPALPSKFESLVYRACPVVDMVDANVVEQVVVDPLVQLFLNAGVAPPANSAPA